MNSPLNRVETEESFNATFEARLRYLASSIIVTIPVRVVREHGLNLGDKVMIGIRKNMADENSTHKASRGLNR